MKRVFCNLWKIIKKNIVSVVCFEAAYRVATFLIIMNCMQLLVDFSLNKQGFSYLTAENYVAFLRSPFTISALVLIGVMILLFFLIEVSALLVCFQYSYRGEKVLISDIFFEGIQVSFRFLKNCRFSWLLCVVLSIPFLEFFLLAREISYIKLLQYTAQIVYEAFPHPWILFTCLGALLLLSLLLVFTLPYCLLEETKTMRGMASGIRLFMRRWKKTLMGFLILHVVILILIGVIYLLVMSGVVLYAELTQNSSTAVSTVLLYSGWVNMGIGIVAGSVELIFSLAFVYAIYMDYHILPKQVQTKVRFRRRRVIAAVLTLVLFFAEGIYVWNLASNRSVITENVLETLRVTAHRGGALMAPENTISALKFAVDSKSDYAEIDIQETKDGELVLLHDNTLKRTTGFKGNIWDSSYAQISKLDAGISFHKKYRGEQIPTLDQAIKFSKGKLDLNIEIKYNGENKGIVKKVVRVIEENDFIDHCVITSMNYKFLKEVKAANPNIRTGYIMTITYGSVSRIEYADFFSVKFSYIDEQFVNEAHAAGKEVHAWTVNYPGTIKRMINYGVDNIITDNPVLVQKVFSGESGTKSGFLELMKYALK